MFCNTCTKCFPCVIRREMAKVYLELRTAHDIFTGGPDDKYTENLTKCVGDILQNYCVLFNEKESEVKPK